MDWSGEAFSGFGTRADAMGGSISTLYPGADVLFANPAGLGFTYGFHITLDWAPGFTIDPGGILGIEDDINETLMETAESNSPDGVVQPGTVEEAVVSSELTMGGGLKGGAIAYGSPVITVGGSFHQPLNLETQLSMSGTEFNAVALNEEGEVTHRIFGTLNGNFNMVLAFVSSSVGIGTRLRHNLAVGLAYDDFSAEHNFEGTFLPEGIISTRNSEAFFNDPRKTQYDSLYAVINGDWDGHGFRFRGGVGYRLTPDLSLDAVVVLPTTIALSGRFRMVHNNIRALNLGAGQDEEVFDVDTLVEDNLTKTEKRITRVPGIDFEIPGSVALGGSMRWEHYLASLVYTYHFNNLGFKLSFEQFDSVGVKIEAGGLHQGLQLSHALRLGIGVEQLMLGLGLLMGETFRVEISENIEDPETPPEVTVGEKSTFILPLFSIGGGIRLTSRLRLNYAARLFSSSFLRFSTSYRL